PSPDLHERPPCLGWEDGSHDGAATGAPRHEPAIGKARSDKPIAEPTGPGRQACTARGSDGAGRRSTWHSATTPVLSSTPGAPTVARVQRVLSTEAVAPRDRVAFWREVICSTFIRLEVTQAAVAGRFRGTVRTSQLGPVQVTRILTDPMAAERTRRHLASLEEERCLLALQLRGRTIGQQDGRHVVLGPGDLALFDSTRAYRVDFQGHDFDHLVLQFPREALRSRGVEPRAVTSRRVAADSRIGRLTSPFLVNLAGVADATSPATAERL